MKLFITKHIKLSFRSSSEITEFYRTMQVDYPKFFKMDDLSKLGFLASELLLKDEAQRFVPREDVAIIGFNRSSSLAVDSRYQATIQDTDNYFPSPSLFVYTLPNIILGEIAIRNKFLGETSFYICEEFDAEQIYRATSNCFSDKTTNSVLAGWIECFEGKYEVLMFLVEKEENGYQFNAIELNKIYKLKS